MKIQQLHRWDVTGAEAARIQRDLRGRLELTGTITAERIHTVAGVDNSYSRRVGNGTAWAAVLVLSFPSLEVIETRVASMPITFPYIPGLLSFREAPAILAAFEQVCTIPDVVLFDAHGYAHPRRFGAASHIGMVLGLPSIGCAKSRLIGEYAEPDDTFGAHSDLRDHGETIGMVVRTRVGHRPLFVSQGNRVGLDDAVTITLACCRNGRFMPEPTRLADQAVRAARARGDG